MNGRWLQAAAVIVLACAATACATPAPPSRSLAPISTAPVWTEDFTDPQLAVLLAAADAGSLDVRIARARLKRAGAEVDLAAAQRALQVTIGLQAAAGAASHGGTTAAAAPTIDAAYEVDLWGRMDRAVAAAMAGRQAEAADVQAARLLVGAETARAYLALRSAEAMEAAALQRAGLAKRAVDLGHIRLAEGRGDSADQNAAAQAVDDARLEAETAHLEASRQRSRLGALAGLTTSADVPAGSGTVPDDAGSAPRAVDSEIVTARPDVRAAYARLSQADALRAEAVAAARPRFIISAGAGTADASVLSLLDARSLAWAVAASLTHTLLDGGANRARIAAAVADLDQADLAYRRAVVQGWSDVREALTDVEGARLALNHAEAARVRAQQSAEAGARRHAAGAISGVETAILDSDRVRAEQAVMAARTEVLKAKVQLTLACGGARTAGG